MKLILSTLFLFVSGLLGATTFYVSPTANDATGNGTAVNPWKSLFKACSTVSTPGDIIHLYAGTYTETQVSQLSVGVSIEGEGSNNTILRSSLTGDGVIMINLLSAAGTSGNQYIKELKLDGQNLSTFQAIRIAGCGGVEIKNCLIENLRDQGVYFTGRGDYTDAAPSIYAKKNSLTLILCFGTLMVMKIYLLLSGH